MDAKPTIVVIGAASATFGPKVLRDVIHHPELGGSTLRLVDIHEEHLDIFTRWPAGSWTGWSTGPRSNPTPTPSPHWKAPITC